MNLVNTEMPTRKNFKITKSSLAIKSYLINSTCPRATSPLMSTNYATHTDVIRWKVPRLNDVEGINM